MMLPTITLNHSAFRCWTLNETILVFMGPETKVIVYVADIPAAITFTAKNQATLYNIELQMNASRIGGELLCLALAEKTDADTLRILGFDEMQRAQLWPCESLLTHVLLRIVTSM